MNFFKKIFQSIIQKPSLYLFIFLIIFSIDRNNRWVNFNKDSFPFVDDVDQFYCYLPAVFIHHDLTFSYPNNYWTVKAANGTKMARPTYGMALMYSPFFFIGHSIAKANNYKTDGYSLPYKWSIHFGTILYSLFGLWFCRKNLLRFFNEIITLITLICVFLGTNLFYYTYGWGEMSHAYLFFIFSVFIYFTIKWYDTKKTKYIFLFSFFAGFATLIRPTDCVILLFPLLLGATNLNELRERITSFIQLKNKLVIAVLLFLFPIFIQMIYWKVYSGSWITYTYGQKERFFFSDPQIFNFLFSFRKGWFIYTPVMFFILIGIPFLRKTSEELFYFLILFFLINVYVLSSWWDWAFGGSFGCRAIIQHYAFFAFGLASFISIVFNLLKEKIIVNYTLRTCLCILFLYLIDLNQTQSWKYKYGLIHYNGMTRDAYFYMFDKTYLNKEELLEFEKKIKIPDINAMLDGKRD